MNGLLPNIRIRSTSGALLVRDGLSLRFFMRRPHQDIVEDVMRLLDRYLLITGRLLGKYFEEAVEEWLPLDGEGWSRVRASMRSQGVAHLTDVSSHERRFSFEYQGTLDVGDDSTRWPNRVCAVELWLPTEFLVEHGPGHVRDLALDLAAPLPWCSGQAGFAFNGFLDLAGVRERIRPLAARHPGIDIVDIAHDSHELGTGVHCPAWLTFLGQPVLGELGGGGVLRSRLHIPGTTVQELAGERVLVTLGPWPETGDIEQGQVLPAYRELARILEPWLFREPDEKNPRYFASAEDRIRWDRRFLD